ncbi:allophanate hydrolase, partial [Candidatus Binatia bacterium]|nr:allophanate hydrolase [Candidatus Binatia bacterium]
MTLADEDVATIDAVQAAYARGATPEEVVDAALARVASCPDPAAWIKLRTRAALVAEAQLLDPARRDELPLWGVPFAVKDNIDCAGLPTTCAYRAREAAAATRDAFVVSRLRAAGAIPLGKTNLDQFATGLVGVRSPYGIPRCVFDADYVSGGSSSGSAVAVARGHVPFALGTDTAGSGRVPAAFNHLVGVKPTRGLLGTSGVVPASRSLDCVSVFAASVAEADLVRRVAQALDPDDAYARPAAMRPLPAACATLGVLAAADREFFGDGHAANLYERALEVVASLGHTLREIELAPFRDAARLLYGSAWVAERLAALEDAVGDDLTALEPALRAILL